MLPFFPAFCWWDMKLYKVFSAFISRPNFLLTNNKDSMFFSVGRINLSFTSHKGVWGSRGTAPVILDICTRWRRVVGIRTWSFVSRGRTSWHSLNRRHGGTASLSAPLGRTCWHSLNRRHGGTASLSAPLGRTCWHSLNRRHGGTASLSAPLGEKNDLLIPPGNKPWNLGCPTDSLVKISICSNWSSFYLWYLCYVTFAILKTFQF